MNLTVLGKYGPYPPAGGATSGYLVQEGNVNMLLECGSGILSRLQQVIPLGSLSAVVLSHLHSDHVADMYILRYALQQLQAAGEVSNIPLKVFTPTIPQAEFAMLRGQGVFEYITVMDGMSARLGDLELFFQAMTHPYPSYGVRIYGHNKVLAYTGDTKLNDSIIPFATNADLLLADTGLLSRDKTNNNVPHLTAREAGEIASAANVSRLLCTHISPRYNEAELLAEAAAAYPSAEIALEMSVYEL